MKTPLAIALLASAAYAQTAAFPGSVATNQTLGVPVNNCQTQLSANVGLSDTSITVASSSCLAQYSLITIDYEIMQVTAIASRVLTVTRAFNGTTATRHYSGAIVAAGLAAWYTNASNAEIKAIETALGANLSNLQASSVSLYNVLPANSAATNSTNMATALAGTLNLYVPPGTYNFSSAIRIIRPGQSITCANPQNTVLQFTGATDGITVDDSGGSTEMNFIVVENCKVVTTNASATAGINFNAVTNAASNCRVSNNWITHSGSGHWTKGIQFVQEQFGKIDNNWIYGEVATGIDLNNFTTAVFLDSNLVGSIHAATATGLKLSSGSQQIIDVGSYYQNAGWTAGISVDASSSLNSYGVEVESVLVAAADGMVCLGTCIASGLRFSGLFVNGYRQQTLGLAQLDHVRFDASASGAAIFLTDGSGYSVDALTNSYVNNTHATGAGVSILNTATNVAGSYIATVGGNALSVSAPNATVYDNSIHSSTGYGISCDATVNLSYRGNIFYTSNLAHTFNNASSCVVYGQTLNWLSGTGAIGTGLLTENVGTAVASATTIAVSSPITHVTGTTTVQTITAPAQFTTSGGCIKLVADNAAGFSTNTAGNIALGSTVAQNKLLILCYDSGASKWYPTY